MQNHKKKSTVERRAVILQELENKGQVNVQDLSKAFSVSEVTIRNDLTNLEKKRMLVRARGGAIRQNNVGVDFNISEKSQRNFHEKQLIGKKAAAMVEEGDTIMLDSGTTTTSMAKYLTKHNNITVITNALNIAVMLAEFPEINVIVPGGILRKKSLSLVGASAEESFRNYFCDKLFIGVDGFDTIRGITTPNVEEAHLNRAMIALAKQVVVVADSSKFSRRSLALIAPISEVDTIITDEGISEEDKQRLENAGVEVILA